MIFKSWYGRNIILKEILALRTYVILSYFLAFKTFLHMTSLVFFNLKMFYYYFILSRLKCYYAKHLHLHCLLCFLSEIYSGKPVWPDLFSWKDLECLQWASRASVTFFRSKLGLLGWWLSPRLGFLLYNTHMPHTVDKNWNNCSKKVVSNLEQKYFFRPVTYFVLFEHF